jgi:hypothetical protein
MHPICRVTPQEQGVLEVSGKWSPEAQQGVLTSGSPCSNDVTEDQHQRHFFVWGNFLMIPSRYHEENEKVTVGT